MDQDLAPVTRPAAAAASADTTAVMEAIDLGETLRILWRRKLVIILTVLLTTLLTALYVFTATPQYRTELQVLFESRVGPVFDFKAAVAGQPQDEASILSEVEVIRSRGLAERVIEKLGLDQAPEFNTALRPDGTLKTLIKTYLPQDVLALVAKEDNPATAVAEDRKAQFERQRIIDAFVTRIRAKQVPRSRAVVIDFTSESPETAAFALNTLAEFYLVARLEDKFANAQRASSWLASRVQKLREKVQESERAVENYRKRFGLFEGERGKLVNEQISDLNTRLTEATVARRAADANLAQVRRLVGSGQNVDSAIQVLQSDLIRTFRTEELDLERREADMGQKFGPRHPAMIQLQAEKERLRQKMQIEIGKIIRSLENEAQVARAREAALTNDLAEIKSSQNQANQASIGLNSLERDAEANRLLLEKFLTAFMESSAQEDAQSQLPDARIISPAPIPEAPSFPKKGFFLALAFVGSVVLGVVLAFAVEYLDAGFRSAEQVESATGMPVLAHVPTLSPTRAGGLDVAAYVLKRPDSAFAEAIRSIFTRLLLAQSDQPPQVVLLLSAEADEGKSTIALSIARQQAQGGRRVVLVDSDFRRSRLAHRVAGLEPKPGLSELLTGKASVDEIIQADPKSSANVVVAGETALDNFDLAGSPVFRDFLDDLRRRYDLVVVDAPPVLALTDAHVVAALADATVMVIRWGKTRRRVARYAIAQISRFGGRINGVALSMVDVRRMAGYGYGDSGYYYGKAAKYYTK